MTKGKKIIPYNLNLKMFLPKKKKSENKSPQEGANCLHNMFFIIKKTFSDNFFWHFFYILIKGKVLNLCYVLKKGEVFVFMR